MGNWEGRDSFEQEKVVLPINDMELKASSLEEMSDLINNRKIDLSNPNHKEFAKNFLQKIKEKWDNSKLEKDDISSAMTSEWSAFRKILDAVKSYKKYVEVETSIFSITESELALLEKYIEDKNDLASETKEYLESLSKWTKYNSIHIESAINAIKKWVLWDNPQNQKFWAFLKTLSEYNSYISTSSTSKWEWDGDNKNVALEQLMKSLRQKWWNEFYNFMSDWKDSEIRDLVKFMKEHLWEDYYNILDWKTITPEKNKELTKLFITYNTVLDSKDVWNLNLNDTDSILKYISDFWWNDQWENSDWVLRANNSKTYSWFLSRIFTNWEWAQSKVVWELEVYNKLKQTIGTWVWSLDRLKSLIAEVVYPNYQVPWAKAEVERAFSNTNTAKELLAKFQNIALWRVSQLRDIRWLTASNAEYNKEIVNQATLKLQEQQKIKEKLEKNPNFVNKLKEMVWAWVPKDEAKKLLDSWTFAMLSNPEIYAWLNITATKNIDINRVVDYLWNTLSETKTEKTTVNWQPYLLLWLNIASFKNRLLDSWAITAEWWVSANAAVWLDGVALPINAWLKLWATIVDRNYDWKSDKLTWNWKIVLGGSLWKDILKNWNNIEMVSADFNWNDMIDSIEKNIHKNKWLLRELIDGDWNLNIKAINDVQSKIDKIISDIWNDAPIEDRLYLETLKTNIFHLDNVISSLSADQKWLEKSIVATWLRSVLTDYEMNLKNANSWINMAWLHIWYMFGVNLLTLGLNFQHIQAAYKSGNLAQRWMDDRMQRRSTLAVSEAEKHVENQYTKNADWTITVKTWWEVEIDKKFKDNIVITENDDWTKTVSSKDKKALFIRWKEFRHGTLSNNFKVIVSNEDFKTEPKKEKVGFWEEVELKSMQNEVEKEVASMLPWLKLEDFKNRIIRWVRWEIEGTKDDFNKLFDLIANYLNNPTPENEWLMKNLMGWYNRLFQNKNWLINNLKPEQLKALATYMMKLTWIDKDAVWRDNVTITDKNRKHLTEVYNAEKMEFAKAWLNSPEVYAAKTKALASNDKLTRRNLSETFKDNEQDRYAKALTMVTSTPKGWEHRLTTIPDVNPEIYGEPVEINNVEIKRAILTKFKLYIEANLLKINAELWNKFPWLQVSHEEYIDMILNAENKDNNVPQSLMTKMNKFVEGTKKSIVFKMNWSSFKSFNVWFEWNECFNAWVGLLLWKLDCNYFEPGKENEWFHELSDIWNKNESMQSTTIGLSYQQKENVHTTEKVEQKPKPEEPKKPESKDETWSETTGSETWTETGTETWNETWTETGTETLPENSNESTTVPWQWDE